jgi:hypothetical protein
MLSIKHFLRSSILKCSNLGSLDFLAGLTSDAVSSQYRCNRPQILRGLAARAVGQNRLLMPDCLGDFAVVADDPSERLICGAQQPALS